MEQSIVKVKGLSHRYSVNWAVRDINFEIARTGILGLLGSNGAGKSTTMNIMCGVLNQTEGEVLIAGYDIRNQPEEAKKQIGFLPQSAPLHLDLTVREYLTHCAYMRLIPKEKIRASVDAAMERCGVAHFSNRLINNLSGGYRQRVGIGQAIIHEPQLVVLDEPTNGLDPNQILEVRSLIKEIASERAVIFSTHILSEVQAICEDIIMIENGQIVFNDTMDAFNNYQQPSSLVAVMVDPPTAEELGGLSGIVHVEFLSPNQVRLTFNDQADIAEHFIRTSVAKNWRLTDITTEKVSLDTIFAHLSNKVKHN